MAASSVSITFFLRKAAKYVYDTSDFQLEFQFCSTLDLKQDSPEIEENNFSYYHLRKLVDLCSVHVGDRATHLSF